MRMFPLITLPAVLLIACGAAAQETMNPFPDPIETDEGVIKVDVVEVAAIPRIDGTPAHMKKLVHEPGTDRLFLADERGPIYIIDEDGGVSEYLNVDAEEWGVPVDASWRETGIQSFAFHPQFTEWGTPGHGKLYVWTDTTDTGPEAHFTSDGSDNPHDTVLLEFTAKNPAAARYDGGPPRLLARFEQPFGNHNGGDIDFNPLASPGDEDFGLLYVGIGDGGSGGDPLNLAQDPGSGFGKIFRIDPMGSNGTGGEYGIPAGNPFAGDGDPATLGEIYAWGVRNPQHLAWDPATGTMYVADIGQNAVEEVSPVTAGADLGWKVWEASFRFGRQGVIADDRRGDPEVTYPVAEYDHQDPLFTGSVAVTGLVVYRSDAIPQLDGRLLFGDLASGEILHVDADNLPEGGQAHVRRVLLRAGGKTQTLLQLIQAKNREQGRTVADRTDLRMAAGQDGRIYLLNKHDSTLRALVPGD
ncbi:MAG: PQQ-dependent sugar dehydrogenase [Gammaproteobacteria bacterium]